MIPTSELLYDLAGLLHRQVSWEDRKTLPNIPAVYFIHIKGEVQYIGQTESLHRRLGSHNRSHQFAKLGVSISWVKTEKSRLIERERQLIEALEPPLNRSAFLEDDQPTTTRKKTSISLDAETMAKLDYLAWKTHRSRSGMISFLVSLFRPTKLGGIEFIESRWQLGDVEFDRNNDDLPQDD